MSEDKRGWQNWGDVFNYYRYKSGLNLDLCDCAHRADEWGKRNERTD